MAIGNTVLLPATAPVVGLHANLPVHSLPRGGAYRDLISPGTATFCLTAPFKPAVHLAGDFNGWDPLATPMQHDGDGHFSVTVPVRGSVCYEFVVTMDDSGGQVCVADPYAREITWDSMGPKAILADDPPFAWRDHAWSRPPLRDLVIYEIGVRDFVASRGHYGSFAGVRSRLDHLVRLGINAIELMPVAEFPGDSSWGYNPVFYMAPKWVYGRPSELKALVDAAHARGLAVILDTVLNHAWPDQPYYRMYPPLFGPSGEMLENLNPFFHHHNNGHANSWGGLDWDHHSPYTLAYQQDIVRFWLEEYHVDGFRFDWLGGVEYDPWQPLRPHFDPFYGIAPIARAARETAPSCYLIGEYWPIHGTNPEKTAARLVQQTEIDAVWNGAFHHTLEACLFETWQWELQDVAHAWGGFRSQGFPRSDQVINYVVSHDERRVEYEIPNHAPHVRPCERPAGERELNRRDVALQKARLALSVLMTAPGVPMLYMGQEFGADNPRTIDFSPLDWSQFDKAAGQEQFDFYRLMLELRREHPALRSDAIEFYQDDFAGTGVLRYKRWDDDGDIVVVAHNFDWRGHSVGLGFPFDGQWLDALTGRRFTISHNWCEFGLPAWSSLVLVHAQA